jgi:hypothetical protein
MKIREVEEWRDFDFSKKKFKTIFKKLANLVRNLGLGS